MSVEAHKVLAESAANDGSEHMPRRVANRALVQFGFMGLLSGFGFYGQAFEWNVGDRTGIFDLRSHTHHSPFVDRFSYCVFFE